VAIFAAADQSISEEDGVVRLELTVDADQPTGEDWHVQYLAPVKCEPGQPMSVQIHWRGPAG
jgi:hypothetical protein